MTDADPTVSCGAYPARAVRGETLTVAATVFREGHDAVAANVVVRKPAGGRSPFLRMSPGADDRWAVPVTVDAEGMWSYAIEAWSDPLGTWWHDAPLKVDAGVDVEVVLEEGARLYERATEGVPKALRELVGGHPRRPARRDP